MEVEVGQSRHIKTRFTAGLQNREKAVDPGPALFNFKEFEGLIKSVLQKAGYKPQVLKFEDVINCDDFTLEMSGIQKQISIPNDL